MAIKVIWTRFAENKLGEIHHYYSTNSNARRATEIVEQIIDATLLLAENPHLGPVEPLLIDREHHYRYLVVKDYKVIYWVTADDKEATVAHVFNTRQNPEKLREAIAVID